jgi:hypothetical protein
MISGIELMWQWRKLVGIELTHDTKYCTAGLKPAPGTGQD